MEKKKASWGDCSVSQAISSMSFSFRLFIRFHMQCAVCITLSLPKPSHRVEPLVFRLATPLRSADAIRGQKDHDACLSTFNGHGAISAKLGRGVNDAVRHWFTVVTRDVDGAALSFRGSAQDLALLY